MKKLYLFLSLIFIITINTYSQTYRLNEETSIGTSYLGKQFPTFPIKEWIKKAPHTKNKYLLIDFWAIFAYPCTSITTPQLNKLYKLFKKEVVVIGISCYDDMFYIRQVEDPIFKYPICSVDWSINQLFNFDGFPVTFLVNPEGKVIWQGHILIPGLPLTEKNIYYLTEEKLKEFIDKDKSERRVKK